MSLGKSAVYFAHLPNTNEFKKNQNQSKINGAIWTLSGMQQEVIKNKITLLVWLLPWHSKSTPYYHRLWIFCRLIDSLQLFFLVSKCNDNIKQLLIMSPSCFPGAWVTGFVNCRNNNRFIKAWSIPLCSLALRLTGGSTAEGFIIVNERNTSSVNFAMEVPWGLFSSD